MSRLADTLATTRKGTQQAVRRCLQFLLAKGWNTDQQAVINIWAETRLSDATWKAMIKALRKAPQTIIAIRSAIRDVCRGNLLAGPHIVCRDGQRFGRAVTLDRFCALVATTSYMAPTDVRRELRSTVRKPLEIVRQRWRNRALGRHLMWAAFRDTARNCSPWQRLPSTADGIRAILGLDPLERGRSLLLLEYALPPSDGPLYPTVADSLSGDSWPYFFRPASDGAPYGLVMSWPSVRRRQGRPEVVHNVITGRNLTARPRVV